METWQAIIAIVTPALGALGTATWKFLRWVFDELQKARGEYLKALADMRADAERKDARIDELHKLRLDDQKKATAELHALADRLLGRDSRRPSSQ